jgi:RimJ/RimL family protein N-acetyltransferase
MSAAGALAKPVPVLETERLILREHRVDDHAACLSIFSDPQVVRHLGGRTSSREEVWRRLLGYAGMWQLLGHGYWALEEKASGRYIGQLGFADFKRDLEPSLDGMLEFGWILASQAHGKGYASEAVAAALGWSGVHFPDRTAVCIIAPDNAASIRVASKAGFRPWRETVYRDTPIAVFVR